MHPKHRKLCNKVSKLLIKDIRSLAHKVRDALANAERFNSWELPIAELLDHLRDKGEIEFMIVEDHELPSEYAISCPDQMLIKCRESVYNGALSGNPRHAFTLAHELGHILLHQKTNPVFARSQLPSLHHYTEDAEWQANTFASELLADCRELQSLKTPRCIEHRFGISFEVAGYVYDRYKKAGFM